jgi:hypothetical protein
VNFRDSIARPASLVFLLLACGGESLVLPDEGDPASITVVLGNGQTGRVGEPLAEPVVALVTDSRGRPVTDVPVVLTLADGAGGEVTPSGSRTGADGTAAFQVVLGARVGQVEGSVAITASGGAPTVQAPLRFTAVSADAAGMSPVSGDGQSAAAGSRLESPLVVQVADAFGNPIPNVTIVWEAAGGGSVSAESTPTDADGLASVERTLGPAAGVQETRASAGGLVGSPVTFIHTATAGSATRLEAVSGNGQSAVVGTPLDAPLVVQLLDPAGNPVPGTAVTWVVGQGAGTVAPETGPTDEAGRAATRWTLGPQAGPQTATAVVSGVGVVGFSATGVPGTPPGLRLVTQPAATARRGVVLSRQPVIQLVDPSGADLREAGVAVTAAVAAGGGTLRGTLTRNTDPEGRAAFSGLSLEGPAGRYTLAFGAAGYSAAISDPIELSRSLTTTTIGGDDPDPSAPGASVRVIYSVVSPGGRPSGNVTVRSEDGATCSAAVSAGACSLTLTAVGSQRLTAAYEGDAEFEPSDDAEDHQVRAASTTLRIESDDPDPSAPGEPVAVRFSVTSTAGTPAGDVTVTADGASCTTTVAAGACSLVLTQPGARTITARYAGGTGFEAASDTEPHTVSVPPPAGPSASASTVVVDPATVAVGGQATISVTVRDAAGNALAGIDVSAAVSGSGNTVSPASDRTNRSGLAQFTVRSSVAEAKTITAQAGGVTLDQRPVLTVTRAATTTRIESDAPDPSDAGQPVEVRVSVRSDGGTPGGTVPVTADGSPGCTAQLTGGTGSCTLTLTTAGRITLTAQYPGDASFEASTATEDHEVRAPAARILTIRTQPADQAVPEEPFRRQPEIQLALEDGGSVPQAGVAVRATIASGGGTLLGTTTVQTGGDGRARFTDLALAGPEGSYTLEFNADGFRSAVSNPIDLRLSATETEITRDDPDPSEPGEAVEVEYRVRSQGRDPTGTVTVSAGPGGPTCSGGLERGEGRCTLALSQEGEITLTATFAGGGGFAASSDEEPHRVEAGNGPPSADDDRFSLLEDAASLEVAAPGVLGNDSDPDQDPLQAELVSSTSAGAVSLAADGGVRYAPPADFFGETSFTYQARDAAGAATSATAMITVQPVNDPPSFAPGPDPTGAAGEGVRAIPGWAGDITPGPGEPGQALRFEVTVTAGAELFDSPPSVSADGTLTFDPAAEGTAAAEVRLVDDGGTANGGADTSPAAVVRFTFSHEGVSS